MGHMVSQFICRMHFFFFPPMKQISLFRFFIISIDSKRQRAGAHVPNPIHCRSTCLHPPPPATVSFLIRSFRFTFPSRFAPSNSTSPQRNTTRSQPDRLTRSQVTRTGRIFGFRSVFGFQTPRYTIVE